MTGVLDTLLTCLKQAAGRQAASAPAVSTFFHARLISKLPPAHFQATIETTWPPGRHGDTRYQALTDRWLIRKARPVAAGYSVLDADEARAAINIEFGDIPAEVDINRWPTKVAVTDLRTDSASQQFAEECEELKRQTALAQAEQEQKLERLRFLGDQVLVDPPLARLWWLDGRPDKLQELVKISTTFEDVRALFVASEERPAKDPLVDLIQEFLVALRPEDRTALIDQLPRIFGAYECDDLAAQLPRASGPDDGNPNGRPPEQPGGAGEGAH